MLFADPDHAETGSAVDCTCQGLGFMSRVRSGRPRERQGAPRLFDLGALRPFSRTELVEFRMTVDAAIWVGNGDVSAPIRH